MNRRDLINAILKNGAECSVPAWEECVECACVLDEDGMTLRVVLIEVENDQKYVLADEPRLDDLRLLLKESERQAVKVVDIAGSQRRASATIDALLKIDRRVA